MDRKDNKIDKLAKFDKRDKTKIYNPTAKTPDTAMNNYGNVFTNMSSFEKTSDAVKEYPSNSYTSFGKEASNSTSFQSKKNNKSKPSYK